VSSSGGDFEVICKTCGQRNDDTATFCGACGAFLEWAGERVETDRAVPATTAPEPAVLGGDAPEPLTEASAARPAGPDSQPAEAVPDVRTGPSTPQAAVQPAPAEEPAAVKPAVPVSRPAPLKEPTPRRGISPGDLICGNCGEGNDPTRRFCRRCGSTLAEATTAVPVRLPWWRRLFTRPPKDPAPAGTRPTPSGRTRRWGCLSSAIARTALVVVVVVVVLFAAVPSLRRQVTRDATRVRRDIDPNHPKIALQSATATGSGGCPAPNVQDNSTVYWFTHGASGTPQVLTVTVASGFKGNLHEIGVTPVPPAQTSGQSGGALPYPQQLQVSSGGAQAAKTLVLANPPKFHSYTYTVSHPQSLQIIVTSTDPGAPPNACVETAYIFYDRT
jgi:hypothetical protein